MLCTVRQRAHDGTTQLTLRCVMKEYLGLFFSQSRRFSWYFEPWPLTSAATARMNVSVTAAASSSESFLLEGLRDRLRGLRLS